MTYEYTVEFDGTLNCFIMEFYDELVVLDQSHTLAQAQHQAEQIVREWVEG